MGKKRQKSAKQLEHAKYLNSKEWKATRQRYFDSKLPQCCYVCLGKRGPFHLHHRTYERWGREHLRDLVPVHKTCHRKIHRFHNKNRKMTLWEATAAVRKITLDSKKKKML